ncbi:reticulon-2a isoform X1 [Gouania willdenowi]|uniref:Reticulon n=1 Tax=Gouania willdenowi TaxID=441366 RepID=A0A8C5ERN1_GOUWI|nr:reticulon-2-like isoform X1 [Gouania willdenowi]
MGQVLGFSQCQEYGSVASTPDSTPPCTDGGNEESEIYELQTAREWSDDEVVGEQEDDDDDDEDGLASSSSIWGTPRQSSLELTFSYIAIAEAESVGASRHYRERRRAGSSRGSRIPLIRTDTLETLLDPPDVEWDPHAFLSQEEEEEALDRRDQEEREARGVSREREQTQTITIQPSSLNLDSENHREDVQSEASMSQTVRLPSPVQPSSEQSHSHPLHHAYSTTPGPVSPVAREIISVKLLTSVQPQGPTPTTSATINLNSQEQLLSDHWFAAALTPEDPRGYTHIAVMDLIYWKETERSGMVLTGLVVGLLSLFQLSIITVVSTVSLAVTCITISVRIYYHVLHAFKWGDGLHPFKTYLDMDISFSGEQADHYMQKLIVTTLSAVNTLKRLFFVENLFESIKLLVLMYLTTYLGRLCNGLTLLIISVIAVFSLPLFYRQRQEQVDSVVAKVQAQVDNIHDFLRRLAQGGGPPPDPTPGGAKPKVQ